MNSKDTIRIMALAAMLVAGSCAAPVNDGKVVEDARVNHPITVEPQYQTLHVGDAGSDTDLSPQDEMQFDAFVTEYLSHGNGSISISAAEGPDSARAIRYFGEKLAAAGVPRERILVGTHPARDGDMRVELGYIAYSAHTDKCGDWTANAADTASNLPMPNFGCATQANLAAMVADPRDIVTPRGMGESDATRRATVLGHYEKGEITSADKRKGDLSNEQSGAISEIH